MAGRFREEHRDCDSPGVKQRFVVGTQQCLGRAAWPRYPGTERQSWGTNQPRNDESV